MSLIFEVFASLRVFLAIEVHHLVSFGLFSGILLDLASGIGTGLRVLLTSSSLLGLGFFSFSSDQSGTLDGHLPSFLSERSSLETRLIVLLAPGTVEVLDEDAVLLIYRVFLIADSVSPLSSDSSALLTSGLNTSCEVLLAGSGLLG
jgi:hypothetical protein